MDSKFSFSEEIITIVAMLSGDSVLVTPSARRKEALAARKKFLSTEGDTLTYLKIFRAYKQASDKVTHRQHSSDVHAY